MADLTYEQIKAGIAAANAMDSTFDFGDGSTAAEREAACIAAFRQAAGLPEWESYQLEGVGTVRRRKPSEGPVFHLRSYGDVSHAELESLSAAAVPAEGGGEAQKLHAAIMNLPCKPYDGTDAYTHYCRGHRDARHAAAELVQYGNCSYWCPACYAAVSEPKHLAALPAVVQGDGASADEVIQLAQALEQRRAIGITEAVNALAANYVNETFRAGFESACEEITHRLRTEEWELCLPPSGIAGEGADTGKATP